MSDIGKKVLPLEDRVAIMPLTQEEKTASGIIIPDTANQEKPNEGKVIAVGPGKLVDGNRVPLELEIGDTVLYSKYAGDPIEVDNEEIIIISQDSVLAIINK
jgi:chaperonin GroES